MNIISVVTAFCSPPGSSRGKRRLSRYINGNNRRAHRNRPGGEQEMCAGDMSRTSCDPTGTSPVEIGLMCNDQGSARRRQVLRRRKLSLCRVLKVALLIGSLPFRNGFVVTQQRLRHGAHRRQLDSI